MNIAQTTFLPPYRRINNGVFMDDWLHIYIQNF